MEVAAELPKLALLLSKYRSGGDGFITFKWTPMSYTNGVSLRTDKLWHKAESVVTDKVSSDSLSVEM
jgi:hypothetical protein